MLFARSTDASSFKSCSDHACTQRASSEIFESAPKLCVALSSAIVAHSSDFAGSRPVPFIHSNACLSARFAVTSAFAPLTSTLNSYAARSIARTAGASCVIPSAFTAGISWSTRRRLNCSARARSACASSAMKIAPAQSAGSTRMLVAETAASAGCRRAHPRSRRATLGTRA